VKVVKLEEEKTFVAVSISRASKGADFVVNALHATGVDAMSKPT
jgi:hypothetical protein